LFDFVSKPTCIRNWNGDPGIGLAFEICDERIKCLWIFRAKFFYGLQTNFRKFETHRRTKANKVNLGFTGFSRRSNNRCIRRETSLEWKLSLEITPLLQYPIAERGKTITQCLQQNCIRQQMLDDSANVGWLSKCWMTQQTFDHSAFHWRRDVKPGIRYIFSTCATVRTNADEKSVRCGWHAVRTSANEKTRLCCSKRF